MIFAGSVKIIDRLAHTKANISDEVIFTSIIQHLTLIFVTPSWKFD